MTFILHQHGRENILIKQQKTDRRKNKPNSFLNAENKVSKFQKNSIQCLLCDFLGSRKEKATGILTLCLLSGKCPKISQRWRQRTRWKSYLPSPEHIPFTFEPREIFKKDLHSQLCADFSLWTTTLFSSARIDKIQRCQYKLNSNNIKNNNNQDNNNNSIK